jgi:hypothetical protein
MRYTAVATGILALAISACGTLNSVFNSNAEERFTAGLVALRRGDFAQANTDLRWVAEHYPDKEIGREALLAVAALEVDPRNPRRRLAMGVDLAESYLRQEDKERWSEPVVQSLRLLAMELGSAEERVAVAEADRLAAERRANLGDLPTLPEQMKSLPARLHAAEDERDKLTKKVEQLEEQIADRDKKLAEKDKELERIRKTIRS